MKIVNEPIKLKPRKEDAHKGNFGRILIAGGSLGMTGAVSISARAALRAGAGLVKVAVPRNVLPIVASLNPCYTAEPLKNDPQGQISSKAVNQILELASQNDVTAFGPGAGTNKGVKDVVSALIKQKISLVIDADGLNCMAKLKSQWLCHNADLTITPHPGEMKRLWKSVFREKMPDDRKKSAVKMAQASNSIVVLKGARTVVTDGNRLYTNNTGNPGMATGGTGDVLTGVIAGLSGWIDDNFNAAVLAVYIHGLAGDLAARKKGQISTTADDLTEALSDAFIQHAQKSL
jgi:NAD(P)H-hydrate epimerase